MTTRLKRRKPKRMGVREDRNLRHPKHCQFVRGYPCSVPGCKSDRIEAAHFDGPIPDEDRGGMGKKDHDKWVLPLCGDTHHPEYHSLGWRRFERKYGIDTHAIAERHAAMSPRRFSWLGGRG